MKIRRPATAQLLLATALSTLVLLGACGGSNPTTQEVFTPKLASALASLSTAAGLASTSVLDLFDASYLDSGATKADVKAALDSNAAALTATPDASLFPLVSITNVTVTGCDANNVCTLNGTLSNADADTTDVAFSTKVKLSNGTYVFLGDQLAS